MYAGQNEEMRESMNRTLKLEEELKGVHSIGIAGHIRPDGDAVGSCLGPVSYTHLDVYKRQALCRT